MGAHCVGVVGGAEGEGISVRGEEAGRDREPEQHCGHYVGGTAPHWRSRAPLCAKNRRGEIKIIKKTAAACGASAASLQAPV